MDGGRIGGEKGVSFGLSSGRGELDLGNVGSFLGDQGDGDGDGMRIEDKDGSRGFGHGGYGYGGEGGGCM